MSRDTVEKMDKVLDAFHNYVLESITLEPTPVEMQKTDKGQTIVAIDLFINEKVREAQKVAYSLGFKAAKNTYSYKMVPRSKIAATYKDIALAYRQTTGKEKSVFLDYLDDMSRRELEES